ncbi:hypothetical protein LX87_04788 [Larkinella arboricola]|uniref:Uncharacterized protein n=1 Tax=Larkinella arboricola TaxID=643671 RepID=A0A327WP56_LARAB|nr:hypothetical protein LX87_04788 [Larkinella arboricola]
MGTYETAFHLTTFIQKLQLIYFSHTFKSFIINLRLNLAFCLLPNEDDITY